MEEHNIVFCSKYSKDNVSLGNAMCIRGFSISGYWISESKINYDSIKSDSGILFTDPKEESFKTFFSSFIWDIGYRPDFFIIKGQIVDLWGVASLIRDGVFDFPCISILDSCSVPLSGFDLMVLDQFDMNLILPNENTKSIEDYLKVLGRIADSGENNSEMMKNIIEKVELIKEFSGIFDNDMREERVKSFIEEFKTNVLNKINRGMKISGAVII